MATGGTYVDTMPDELVNQLEEIAGSPYHRWPSTIAKLPSQRRLEFGQAAMGVPVKRVWVTLEYGQVFICAEW